MRSDLIPKNMRKNTLIILTALFATTLSAQTDSAATPKTWKWSGLYNLSLTQTSLTNWAAGGNNNVNLNGLLKQAAVMDKSKWTWSNLLEANFGYNFQPDLNNKTDDRLEFTTRDWTVILTSRNGVSVYSPI